jgi:hypothetical protein
MQKNTWQKHWDWDVKGSMKLEGFQECACKLQRMLEKRFANARQAFAIFDKSGTAVTRHADFFATLQALGCAEELTTEEVPSL